MGVFPPLFAIPGAAAGLIVGIVVAIIDTAEAQPRVDIGARSELWRPHYGDHEEGRFPKGPRRRSPPERSGLEIPHQGIRSVKCVGT
jgi:hypothetical protein